MARDFPATPAVGLCPAEGIDLRAAEKADVVAAFKQWPLQSYAKAAAVLHLGLLLFTAMARFAVQPAQAAVFAGLDATAHGGLLIASGAVAAMLALAAAHQNNAAHATSDHATSDHGAGHHGASQYRHEQPPNAEAIEPAAWPGGSAPRPGRAASRQDRVDLNWAELMARANHELRTPLNAVIGFSDVMQRELLGPIGHDRYKDYIRHIRESGFALLKSAEDTLAMTSLVADRDGARSSCLELEPLLRQAWCHLSHEADGPGIVLDPAALAQLKRDEVSILGDEQALKQALINLFSEAIRVSRPHQEICLGIETTLDAVHLTIACAAAQSGSFNPHLSSSPHHHGAQQDRPDPGGLGFAMARYMLELQGAALTEQHDRSGEWRVSVQMPAALSA